MEQTRQNLIAQAASRDDQEGAGRRAVETVLLRFGYMEFRGTMSTDFRAAGRKEQMGATTRSVRLNMGCRLRLAAFPAIVLLAAGCGTGTVPGAGDGETEVRFQGGNGISQDTAPLTDLAADQGRCVEALDAAPVADTRVPADTDRAPDTGSGSDIGTVPPDAVDIAAAADMAALETAGCGNGLCEAGEDCATCPGDCGACPPPTDPPGGRTRFVVAIGKIHSGDAVQDWVRLGTYVFDPAAQAVTAALWKWSQVNPTHRAHSGVTPNSTCSGWGAGEVRPCDILMPEGFKDPPNDNREGTYAVLSEAGAPYVRIEWSPDWYEEWWLPTEGTETYAVLRLKDSDKATVAFAYGSDASLTERRAYSTIVQETGLVYEKWVRKQACSDCTYAAVTKSVNPTNQFQSWSVCGDGLSWVMTWYDPESSDNCNGSDDSSIQYYMFRPKVDSRRDGWWFWHTCKTEGGGWNACYGCDNSDRHGGSHVIALMQILDDQAGFVGYVGVEVGFDEGSCADDSEKRYSDVLAVLRLAPETGYLNTPAVMP